MDSKPVLLFDAGRRIAGASSGGAAVLDLPEESMVGMACRDAFACPACTGEACPLRQSLAGEAVEGLLPGLRTGGPLAVSAWPVRMSAGQMAMLELRTPEPEEAMLGAGLQNVLDGLRTITRSDLAALAFYDEGAREIRWQVTSGSVSPAVQGIRLRPGQGFAGRIVLTNLPLTTFRFPSDLTGDPASYPIFQAEGLRAAIGVPLHGNDRVLGVLLVASRTDRTYSDEDLERLTQSADSLGLAAQMMVLYSEAIRAERAKLAHEVHDGLSQNLFGLKLLLFDLQEQYQAAAPGVQRGLSEVVKLLDSTLVEVRRFIGDLRRTSAVQRGLVSAISDYLGHFYRLSRTQLELAVRLDPGEEVECKDRAEVLRIVQEALVNVQRHAQATQVRVEIFRSGGQYCIGIIDDGKGFDPHAVGEGHFGLNTMRERAARLGGELSVRSAPGQGTTVTLCLPAG